MNPIPHAALLFALTMFVRAEPLWKIESIASPEGVEPQLGAIAFMSDGRLMAAFHHGEVAFRDPKSGAWKIFARGLHEPLGILPHEDGKSVYVMQRPELTLLRDTDGDGTADEYQNVCDDFGLSGNYHEFAYGPVRDSAGNLYIALNLASNADGIMPEIRGDFRHPELAFSQMIGPLDKDTQKKAGRMYSAAPKRGWILKLPRGGGETIPWADGFRSPDGLCLTKRQDGEEMLMVSDNQGDWRGSSEIHVVKQGGFYGNPASLIWREHLPKPAKDLAVSDLNNLRTPAAVWTPHGILANSPTQMVPFPDTGTWSAFEGQWVMGEMNYTRLIRVMLEDKPINGLWQGACVSLLEEKVLGTGGHRLAFDPEGNLWIGRTHLAWAGGEGLRKIAPPSHIPFAAAKISIHSRGFRIRFTEPVSPESLDPDTCTVERWTYAYHEDYGSPQLGQAQVKVNTVTWESPDTCVVDLGIPVVDTVHAFDLSSIRSTKGGPLSHGPLYYTVRAVPE